VMVVRGAFPDGDVLGRVTRAWEEAAAGEAAEATEDAAGGCGGGAARGPLRRQGQHWAGLKRACVGRARQAGPARPGASTLEPKAFLI